MSRFDNLTSGTTLGRETAGFQLAQTQKTQGILEVSNRDAKLLKLLSKRQFCSKKGVHQRSIKCHVYVAKVYATVMFMATFHLNFKLRFGMFQAAHIDEF